jgi:molecular chaperone DnaK
MIYQAEKMIAENAEKLDEADKTVLEAALTDAKADLESGDAAKLDAARQRVEAELHKIAEKLYKSESAGAEGGSPADANASGADSKAGTGADDDVIDAEFTQENDDS